jgi:PST family polysaccharide transporter/teichuronic acid exporter
MSLRAQTLKGTFWTTVSAATRAVIQILRLAILTRFLEKSDFGLVAIVVLVVGFAHILTDLGVSASLFSTQHVSQKVYSSLYWVSLLLSVGFYLVLLAVTPFVAGFYHLPELTQLIPVMGVELILGSMGRQFRVFREKALEFKALAIIDITSLLCSLIVAYVLAVRGAGIYSLIISALFTSLTAGIMLIITGYRKHPLVMYINLREGRSFYKIGFYQTGSQILDYIASQIDILLIGKLVSVSDLGVYNLVKQLVLKTALMINPVITGVAVPVLAKFQDDLKTLKEKYLQTHHAVSFVNFGVYGLLALVGPEILYFVYGPAYATSAGTLQLLCVWGAFTSIGSTVMTLVIIQGRTDLGLINTTLRVLVNPIFVLVGASYGILGIVVSQAIFSILFFGLNWLIVIKRILKSLSFRRYLGGIVPFLLFSLIAFSVLFAFKITYDRSQQSAWMCLGLWIPAFGLLYWVMSRKTFTRFVFS